MKSNSLLFSLLFVLSSFPGWSQQQKYSSVTGKPNIVLIYTDDVGYGDIGANGAKTIATPNIDKLASSGVRFTHAHTTSATCTPSRYSLLTGMYAWRKQGTGIAAGNASLLIPTDKVSLPGM